nr:hypothetical protein BaRGS_003746 [Batillaria attramentaria]
MDDTLDSNQLSTLQSVSLDTPGPSTLGEESNGDLDRTVDSSAISDMDESVASDSEAAESSNMEVEPSPFRALVAAARSEDKENQPSTSGMVMMQAAQPVPQTRKSTRLANLQEEISSSRQRLQYESRPYNSQELWCEECQTAYEGQCLAHRLAHVPDKVVLSRAWASLPGMLQIFRLAHPPGNNDTAVFAKRQIAKMSQFGPFIGDLVDTLDEVSNKNFVLMFEKPDKTVGYFDTRDENKCNWMMFVRPAANFAEQNLVAYQHGQGIYFTVTKTIEPRQELKVWYAAHYAERLGLKAHEPTDADWALLDEQASRFECNQCNSRFRTSMALQRHLLDHEKEDMPVDAGKGTSEEEGTSDQEDGKKRKKRVRLKGKGALLKGKNRQGNDSSGYQWKKKSTSIYLNKTLKKYQKRPGMRQTIKSLYKRKGQGAGGGQEWVCTHCNLTFDNSNLLNLHTLTHAAEDVGLDEIRKLTYDPGQVNGMDTNGGDGGDGAPSGGVAVEGDNLVSLETYLACPMCRAQFEDKRALIEHAAEHARQPTAPRLSNRPFKCQTCWKAFSAKEKLQRHLLCHGDDESKPLECEVCLKRFMNNSALACHLKTHSEKKYYECPLCHEGYDHINLLKQHVTKHADSYGNYTCPYCEKSFDDFNFIRKHMRSFHSEKEYPCPDCNRVFPRPDKLKLHMLRHTSHREFMCETCGRQFKRKDKLKEHIKRMHSAERETRLMTRPERQASSKKFIPKVSPTDYHRFIYKCHTCLLGFKRRGMLVNHLAKRHPDVKPESVPELNLPILKTQRDYYCQHCDKVYKSSSKRKAHIIKNHPGAELPPSSRKKPGVVEAPPGVPNMTYSQTVGSITTMPQNCEFCHKQYASKAKLMQHQRKCHPEMVPAIPERRKSQSKEGEFIADLTVVQTEDGTSVAVERYDDVVVAAPSGMAENLQAADLLTQAMSELTQSLELGRPRMDPAGMSDFVKIEIDVAEEPMHGPGTTAPALPAV